MEAADGRPAQAALRPNPGLSVEAENFAGRDDLRGFDGAEYTAQLEQTLEIGGKRGKRMHVAETEKQLAGFDLAARRLDILAETTRRFVAVLGAQERLVMSKEALALAEEFVKAVATRVQAGKSSPMEEEKAGILLAEQKTGLDSAARDLHVARIRLSAMWGSVTPTFNQASGELSDIPSVPDLASLAGRMTANPDLARWAVELEQRKAVLDQEQAARAPDVTLACGLRQYSDSDSQAFVAGISIPLPLFDRNQAKIKEAALLVEKADQERRAAEVGGLAALAEAHQMFSAALTRVAGFKGDVIPRSKSVFEAVQKGYIEGKFSYLDVLDARRTFFEARAAYVEALVAGHRARVDVARLVGEAAPVTAGN
jgi:cobalt-zinc-cadmium efflux system outer membrane protein